MTARTSSIAQPSTLVDYLSSGQNASAAGTGVRALAVLFVTALTAALSQVSFPLPFTPVPFTLQPMVVLVGAAALGARLGAMSQILYLMLGIAGLPVFAYAPELPQGALRLLGPTGGFLMAYPLAAFVTGWLAERGMDRRVGTSLLAMTAGLGTLFAGGVLWLAQSLGLQTALAVGLYPFVVVDVIKIAVSAMVLPGAWKVLKGSERF